MLLHSIAKVCFILDHNYFFLIFRIAHHRLNSRNHGILDIVLIFAHVFETASVFSSAVYLFSVIFSVALHVVVSHWFIGVLLLRPGSGLGLTVSKPGMAVIVQPVLVGLSIDP